MSEEHVPYAGVATRAVALAVDAVLSEGIVFALGAVLVLVGSLVAEIQLGTPAKVLAVCAWTIIVGGYFVTFWSTAGQTPGMRLMSLRVVGPDGNAPSFKRAVVRVVGLAIAIVPAFAGFLPVLVDNRRRGVHDLLARTVVIYDGATASGSDARAADAEIEHRPPRTARIVMTPNP